MMAILSRMLLSTTPPAVDPGVSGEMYSQAVVALAMAIPSMVNPRATSGAKMRGCVTAAEFMMGFLCLMRVTYIVVLGVSCPLAFALLGSGWWSFQPQI